MALTKVGYQNVIDRYNADIALQQSIDSTEKKTNEATLARLKRILDGYEAKQYGPYSIWSGDGGGTAGVKLSGGSLYSKETVSNINTITDNAVRRRYAQITGLELVGQMKPPAPIIPVLRPGAQPMPAPETGLPDFQPSASEEGMPSGIPGMGVQPPASIALPPTSTPSQYASTTEPPFNPTRWSADSLFIALGDLGRTALAENYTKQLVDDTMKVEGTIMQGLELIPLQFFPELLDKLETAKNYIINRTNDVYQQPNTRGYGLTATRVLNDLIGIVTKVFDGIKRDGDNVQTRRSLVQQARLDAANASYNALKQGANPTVPLFPPPAAGAPRDGRSGGDDSSDPSDPSSGAPGEYEPGSGSEPSSGSEPTDSEVLSRAPADFRAFLDDQLDRLDLWIDGGWGQEQIWEAIDNDPTLSALPENIQYQRADATLMEIIQSLKINPRTAKSDMHLTRDANDRIEAVYGSIEIMRGLELDMEEVFINEYNNHLDKLVGNDNDNAEGEWESMQDYLTNKLIDQMRAKALTHPEIGYRKMSAEEQTQFRKDLEQYLKEGHDEYITAITTNKGFMTAKIDGNDLIVKFVPRAPTAEEKTTELRKLDKIEGYDSGAFIDIMHKELTTNKLARHIQNLEKMANDHLEYLVSEETIREAVLKTFDERVGDAPLAKDKLMFQLKQVISLVENEISQEFNKWREGDVLIDNEDYKSLPVDLQRDTLDYYKQIFSLQREDEAKMKITDEAMRVYDAGEMPPPKAPMEPIGPPPANSLDILNQYKIENKDYTKNQLKYIIDAFKPQELAPGIIIPSYDIPSVITPDQLRIFLMQHYPTIPSLKPLVQHLNPSYSFSRKKAPSYNDLTKTILELLRSSRGIHGWGNNTIVDELVQDRPFPSSSRPDKDPGLDAARARRELEEGGVVEAKDAEVAVDDPTVAPIAPEAVNARNVLVTDVAGNVLVTDGTNDYPIIAKNKLDEYRGTGCGNKVMAWADTVDKYKGLTWNTELKKLYIGLGKPEATTIGWDKPTVSAAGRGAILFSRMVNFYNKPDDKIFKLKPAT